jgi:DNA-binding NtrC family response regulator
VRILSTTNQDLEQKLKDRSFREDLFYRLNVVSIKTPSLEEVNEDIPLLADHFARQVCSELGVEYKQFSPQALDMLMHSSWPGNVRQLQNFVRRAIIFTGSSEISTRDVALVQGQGQEGLEQDAPAGLDADLETEPYSRAKERVLQRFSAQYARQLLQRTEGNISQAAKLAGLSRVALQKLLRRTGVDPAGFRQE